MTARGRMVKEPKPNGPNTLKTLHMDYAIPPCTLVGVILDLDTSVNGRQIAL